MIEGLGAVASGPFFMEACMEQWKPVTDFEDSYEVSNYGRVRSLTRRFCIGRVRTLRENPAGYPYVVLSDARKGLRTTRCVHRLVLDAFVGQRPKGMEARHLDGTRNNNRLENLCWGTKSENMMDKVAHGTSSRGAACGNAKLTKDDVLAIRAHNGSQQEVADKFGISQVHAGRIINRECWTDI